MADQRFSAAFAIDLASSRLRRGVVGVSYSAFALAGYVLINGRAASDLHLMTGLDAAIPFWPSSLWVYLSFYVALVYAAFMAEEQAFLRLLRAATLVLIVAWTSFLAFPTPIVRPDPGVLASPFWRWAFTILHGADLPANTFPSLHVAGSVMVARAMGGSVWMGWAAAVGISTLTTKQHYVADVAGGALLALLAWWWMSGRPMTGRDAVGSPR